LTSKPQIVQRRTVARSRLFQIDAVELMFGNGARREFEQLVAGGDGGVVVIPVTDEGRVVLVEEFALGRGDYELGFVKGLIDPGESPHVAAARELREETGFAPSQLVLLDTVTLMPAYSNFRSHLFIATGLYRDPLDGDEPEPLRQHLWPIENLDALHADPRMTDARTRLALYLLADHLAKAD
jgi:ADP-ribose diphosphatase